LGRRQKSHHRSQSRAFAGTVAADKDGDRIGPGLKRKPLKNMMVADKGMRVFNR
jgi:hypothetical protein